MADDSNDTAGSHPQPGSRHGDAAAPDESADLPLDPFVLEEQVGVGGTGVVWQGRHPGQDVPVAIKLITKLGSDPEATRRRFRSEVRAVSALDHPGIVSVLDYGETDVDLARGSDGRLPAGIPYLVTEFAEAGTLSDYLGEMNWPFCRALLLAILDSLAHAHARGVVHRDIKPTNILLDHGIQMGPSSFTDVDDPGALRLKLTDFGLAFQHDDALDSDGQADDNEARGTPFYMAPEQLQSRWRDFGPWSDLYGVGCMAWQMITGQRPFTGDSMLAVARAQLVEPPPKFDPKFDVPDRLVNWLATLLQKRPEDRFQTAADAAAALTALGDDSTDSTDRVDYSLRAPDASFPGEWSSADTPPELDHSRSATRELDLPDGFPTATQSDDERSYIPPVARSRPPVPDDWSRPDTDSAPMALVGAGRKLFGLQKFPLAGRHDERDHLWETFHRVIDEQAPRVVLLNGPAGIGKTRLAHWLIYRAREVGAAWTMRASHDAGDTLLGALRDMIARHLGSTGLERDEIRKRVVDGYDRLDADEDHHIHVIDTLTDWLAPDPDLGPSDVKNVFGTVLQFLERVAARRPLIVHLDDLHHGGDTLEWLQHVLRVTDQEHHGAAARFPVLFVGTYRTEGLGGRPAEAGAIDALNESSHVSSLRLEPLENHALRTLLERGLRLEPGLSFRVVARADGNPLFATQLVRDWLERGLLEVAADGFTLPDDADGLLPDDIYAVWSDRLERALGEAPRDQRVALELGAVLGRQPREEEWRAACHRAGVSFPEQLIRRLLKQRLIEATETGWSFPHSMLRETLERDARRAGRWTDHNRVCADIVRGLYDLEAISEGTEAAGVYERLAHFWLEAGEVDRALAPLLRATEYNGRLGRLDAVEYLLEQLDSALERADLDYDDDDPRIDRLELKKGRYHVARRAEPDTAHEHLQNVIDRTEGRPNRQKIRAQALVGLARLAYLDVEVQKAADFLGRALQICPKNKTALRAQILREQGVLARRSDALDAPERYYHRARDLLDDAPVERAKVEAEIANQLARRDAHDEAIDTFREALSTFREHRCRTAEADVLNRLANYHRSRGNYPRALELFRRAEDMARSTDRSLLPMIRLGLVEVSLERQNYASALDILERLPDPLPNESLIRLKTVYACVAHLGLDHREAALESIVRIESWSKIPLDGESEYRHFLRKARTLANSRGHADIASRIEALGLTGD